MIGDARVTLPNIKQKIDIIYQDAFSPSKNQFLWTREYFAMLRQLCSDDALMTTYSSATSSSDGNVGERIQALYATKKQC